MINNEFHVIGIATSNYQDIGNSRFSSFLLRIEVEKFNSKFGGKPFELEVQVYGTNKAVKTDVDVLGKLVAVNGYLDTYETEKGTLVIKCVAQNVYVLENNARKIKTAEIDNKKQADFNEMLKGLDEPEVNDVADDDDADDDELDLPF